VAISVYIRERNVNILFCKKPDVNIFLAYLLQLLLRTKNSAKVLFYTKYLFKIKDR
jgi:hypothetical protein